MYGFTGTVVGLRFKGGIALASDTRSTAYYLVLSKKLKKIFKITDHVAGAFTGSPGDVQALVSILQAEARLFEVIEKRRVSSKVVTQIASNYLSARRIFPMLVDGMIGGFDQDGPHLYCLDAIGGKIEERKFASSGTGSTVAYGVLEQSYKDELDEKEGAKLAALAIRMAIERDAATGDGITVAIINEKGFRELSEEEISKLGVPAVKA